MAQVVTVTPDKRTIIAGAGDWNNRPGYIKFWAFNTGKLIRSDKWSHYEMHSLLVTPDSRSVIVSGRDDHTFSDGTFYILIGDIETGEYRTIKQGRKDAFSLNLSLTWDKKYLLFGEYIWDWQIGGIALPKRDSDPLLNRRIMLTAKHVLESTDEGFVVQDFQAGKIVQKINTVCENERYRHSPMKVTPDKRYILSQTQKGSYRSGNQVLAMWDIYTGSFVKTYDNCQGTIASIDVTTDGQYAIVLTYAPDMIKVLNLQTGKVTRSIYPDK